MRSDSEINLVHLAATSVARAARRAAEVLYRKDVEFFIDSCVRNIHAEIDNVVRASTATLQPEKLEEYLKRDNVVQLEYGKETTGENLIEIMKTVESYQILIEGDITDTITSAIQIYLFALFSMKQPNPHYYNGILMIYNCEAVLHLKNRSFKGGSSLLFDLHNLNALIFRSINATLDSEVENRKSTKYQNYYGFICWGLPMFIFGWWLAILSM